MCKGRGGMGFGARRGFQIKGLGTRINLKITNSEWKSFLQTLNKIILLYCCRKPVVPFFTAISL